VQPTGFVARESAEAPPRGGLVEAFPGPFRGHEEAARLKSLGDQVDDGVKVGHVVQRRRRHDRSGRLSRVVLLEQDLVIVRTGGRLGIDAFGVKSLGQQRRDETAERAAAEVHHPARRRRQVLADERPGRGQPTQVGGG